MYKSEHFNLGIITFSKGINTVVEENKPLQEPLQLPYCVTVKRIGAKLQEIPKSRTRKI